MSPLEISEMYPVDIDSTDSCDDNSNSDPRYQRRKLLMQMTNCGICGMEFVSAGNARRHEKNVHNYHGRPHPNPLNPQIMMNHSKAKSVMEPEILMEVDNESIFQSLGDNTDDDQSETISMFMLADFDGELTEENIDYIEKYKYVIESVQAKTCFCCNRRYDKMKPLLAHLRKKTNVPPYQCFSCMLSLENRSDYVQHMKMRQCKNLYALYKKKVQSGEIQPREYIENDIPEPEEQNLQQNHTKVPLKDALMYRVFACNFCEFTNRIKAVIKKHLNTEHLTDKSQIENPVQCQYCQKVFEDADTRRRHNSNHDCTSHVICELCGEKFDTLPPFNEHASAVHANTLSVRKIAEMYDINYRGQKVTSKSTKCIYCPKVYSSYHNMTRHINKHHNPNNPYKCDDCKETFARQGMLQAHYSNCIMKPQGRGEEMQYNFSCKDCGVLFATLEGWTKHQEIHKTCQQCGQSFNNQQELDMHKKEHLKVKFYTCNICGNSYSDSQQLSEHMVEHGVQNKEDEHFCEICQTTYSNIQDYSEHMKLHNIDIPIPENFDEENNDSLVEANVEKPAAQSYYKCSICSKHVETKQGLQRHMLFRHKRHISTLPGYEMSKPGVYRCDLCPKRYSNARGVIRHKRNAHSNWRHMQQVPMIEYKQEPLSENERVGQSPKFCNQCGLSGFLSQNDLNKHRLLSHHPKGAKICTICNFIAKDAKKMWYHKKKYHAIPGSSNQCTICRKLFVTKPQLIKHIKTMHFKLPMEIEVTSMSAKQVENKPMMAPLPYTAQSETGPWTCDLCPKIFHSVNALKSHRGWHLRSPENKTSSSKLSLPWLPRPLQSNKVIKRIKLPTAGPSQDGRYFMSKFKVVPKLPAGAYCRLCNKTFSKIAVYKRHIAEYHRAPRAKANIVDVTPHDLESMQQLTCSDCNESFSSKVEWIEHRVQHITQFVKDQNLAQWPCFCGKLFGRKDNLKSHIKTHMHNVQEFPNANDIPQSSTGSSNVPLNAASVNRHYSCNPCRMTFKSEEELRGHTSTHNVNGHTPKVWKCDFCGFTTEDIKLYQECRRAHHIPTKFKCEGCHVFFKSYNILVKHHDDHHKNDGVPLASSSYTYDCTQCGKSYSMKHHLKRHIDSAH